MNVAGRRVLVFGDSMSHVGADSDPEAAAISLGYNYGTPGAAFLQNLLAAGASSARIDARIGRSAYNFWGREDTTSLLNADVAWGPDLVFVFLGTNDLGLNMSVDGADMARIRDAYAQAGAEIWGIGPPSFADPTMQAQTDAVVAMMQQVFGANFIDARPLTADLTSSSARTSDGVHFQNAAGAVFGGRLAQAALATAGSAASGPSVTLLVAGLGFLALLAAVVVHGRRRAFESVEAP